MKSTSDHQSSAAANTDAIQIQVGNLGKSIVRSSWAMAVFGAQQMVNMVTLVAPNSRTSSVTSAFNTVANTMEMQLNGVFRGAYKTGKTKCHVQPS
jgi:hypothetical protein